LIGPARAGDPGRPRGREGGRRIAASFSPPLQVRLLVMQPTPFCNLDCTYCYLPHRDDKRRLARTSKPRSATSWRAACSATSWSSSGTR
jgi:hypothetical protein